MHRVCEFRRKLVRRKHMEKGDLTTKLKRCLNTFDVTMIGIGHMVGAGIFVTTGEVMKNIAGPSTILSYLVAGIAALLSALCYAEFGSRYPKAGSAYTYAYVGCGEIWAFIIGWNIVLEHVLSGAAVARTFSGYLNELVNGAITRWERQISEGWWFRHDNPLNVTNVTNFEICSEGGPTIEKSLLGEFPDLVSVAAVVLAALFVAVGSKAAAHFNSIFSIANLLVILIVVGYGVTFANLDNWANFFPCGMNGVLAGSSKCFFAYVGFDGLATAGEEAKNPSVVIPRATYLSMGIVTVTYIAMATVLSLMLPYNQITLASVYSSAFNTVGAPSWVGIVVAVGALLGIVTSLVGSLFSLPRAVYAMADDGLIFGFWAKVNSYTRTPLVATITFSLLTAVIAFFIELDALVDFLSSGTILAYSLVAAALLILRYRPNPIKGSDEMDEGGRIRPNIPVISSLFSRYNPPYSTYGCLFTMIVAFTVVGVLISSGATKSTIGFAFAIATGVIGFLSVVLLHCHQQNTMDHDFKVALVPYLPAASLFVNIVMLTQLTYMTWIRLAVWMTIGLAIYLVYGVSHSKEGRVAISSPLSSPKTAWESESSGHSMNSLTLTRSDSTRSPESKRASDELSSSHF